MMSMTMFRALLCLEEGPRTAAEMLARIAEVDGARHTPSVASLYREIKRALDAQWVEVAPTGDIPQTAQHRRGRPGQSYQTTATGRAAVRDQTRRLRSLAGAAAQEGRR